MIKNYIFKRLPTVHRGYETEKLRTQQIQKNVSM